MKSREQYTTYLNPELTKRQTVVGFVATRVCAHDYEASSYPRFILIVVMVLVGIIYEYTDSY